MRCWESEFFLNGKADQHQIYQALWAGFERQGHRPAPFIWGLTDVGTVLMRSREQPGMLSILRDDAGLRCATSRRVDYEIDPGNAWRFVMVCCPTRRENRSRKRRALMSQRSIWEWLARKGKQHGFNAERLSVRNFGPARWVSSSGHRAVHGQVEVSGVLTIIDADAFSLAMFDGIGSSKSAGMGMIILEEPDYGHATISNNGQTDKRSGNADRSNRSRRIVGLGGSSA